MSTATKKTIRLPYNLELRSYQKEMWDALVHVTPSGEVKMKKKRACLVHHRRAGKDKNCINFMAFMAWYHRVGTYYYVLPTFAQAKRVIWDGIGKDGFRFIDHLPKELIYSKNETELQVVFKHPTEKNERGEPKPGSVIQLIGSDNIDSIVGTNPVGLVFSEYSLQSPKAWTYLQPIVRENGGWAIFVFTPRGKNHAYRLAYGNGKQQIGASKNPDWFFSLKTIDETSRDAEGEDKSRVVTLADVEADKAEGMDDETALQEYWCSFDASIQGSYYGKLITSAYREGRVKPLEWDPMLPVITWWDIGRNDTTAIWFVQPVGRALHWLDYYENSDQGLPHYAKIVTAKEYGYAYHAMPHDIGVTEWGTDTRRIDMARKLGLNPIRTAKKLDITEGIEAVRRILPMSYFNETTLGEYALGALMHYHKEYDEEREVYKNTPLHDWSSNLADAVRTGSLLYRPGQELQLPGSYQQTQTVCDTQYDIFG